MVREDPWLAFVTAAGLATLSIATFLFLVMVVRGSVKHQRGRRLNFFSSYVLLVAKRRIVLHALAAEQQME